MTTSRTALFPGSFDPMTLGHVNLIERGLRLFDTIIVGVAVNISKTPMFELERRCAFIEQAFPGERVEVAELDGLLVEEAVALGCQAILRGIRSAKDFDYEYRMTAMNRELEPSLETVFLLAEPQHVFVSSSLIKEVARFGGDFHRFVPPHVAEALARELEAQ